MAAVSATRARYALAALLMINIANFIDRQVLSILLEPIKRDLLLSDTQLGLLSGLAFALFYASFGIPIAKLADRRSRRNVIAVSLVLWSIATMACGAARSFGQLLLARTAVAVGEAGGGPPSHSIIADLFPPGRRATALAIYACGVPLGSLVGLSVGGWLNQAFDWRFAFAVVGAPGLLLALLFVLTVREPARLAPSPTEMSGNSTLATVAALWRIPSYRSLICGVAAIAVPGQGIAAWLPVYFIRTFGADTRAVGLALGLTLGIAGGLGTLFGGVLADRLGRHGGSWYAWVPAWQCALGVPFFMLLFLLPTTFAGAAALIVLPALVGYAFTGPVYAAVQSIAPPRSRATAAAFLLFVFSLVGLGVGPTLIGMLSDVYAPVAGAASLRWAMLTTLTLQVVGIWQFTVAGRRLPHDLAAAGQ